MSATAIRHAFGRRVVAGLAVCAAAAVVTAAAFPLPPYHMPLRLNLTPSLPAGFYAVSYTGVRLSANQTVLVCLPGETARLARERGYIGRGDCPDGSEPLLKRIAAIPGDTVTVSADGIAVNGAMIPNTAPLRRDSAGRTLAAMPPGRYPVKPGAYWLIANADPRSFDSRYYGPLSAASVIGDARPLVTF